MSEKIKIFIVSDATNFALTDIYNGYINALQQLKISHETFPYHHFRRIVSDETCYHILHSTALMKSKAFTHVMFIGGLNIPDFVFESLYHVKSIVCSSEDPHSSSPMIAKLGKIDYYFTNERSIARCGRFKNVFYCPTAGSSHECGRIPLEALEDRYKSDILFLGAIYPNRARLLESIIPFVDINKLSFKVCGHIHYLPKASPLWKYAFDARTIPHQETVKYYNGAKIAINILRDIHWNPKTKSKKNPHNRSRFTAESLNPRAYEVPLCQTFMLLDDSRPEARDVFTEDEVGFFSDENSLKERLEYFLMGPGKNKMEQMAFNGYKKVAENHTYNHRLLYIKDILEKNPSPAK